MGEEVTNLGESSQSLAAIFARISKDKKTGVISLSSSSSGKSEFKKEFVFDRGVPVAVVTNRSQERLAYFLLVKGIITKEQIQSLTNDQVALSNSEKVLGYLMSKAWIDSVKIPEILEAYFEEKLFSLLTTQRAVVRFVEMEKLPEKALSIDQYRLSKDFPRALWENIKARYEDSYCRSRLSKFSGARFKAKSDFVLPLQAAELRLWNQLKNNPLDMESLDALQLRSVAFGLETDLIEVVQSKNQDQKTELTANLKELKKKDFYAILEVEETAATDLIKKNYLQLVKKYHPDRVAKASEPEIKKICEDILAVINEAYDTLSDHEKREEYDAERAFEAQGGMAGIERRLKAEATYEEARMAFRKKQYDRALELFKSVEVYQNDFPDFPVEIAFTRALVSGSDKSGSPEAILAEIQKIESFAKRTPTLLAHYSLGILYRMAGRGKDALDHFDRVLQMDPNHAEAAIESRVLRSRLEKKEDKQKSKSWFKKS